MVRRRAEHARTRTVESRAFRVEGEPRQCRAAGSDGAGTGTNPLRRPIGRSASCAALSARPSSYMRAASRAAGRRSTCNTAWSSHRAELVKTLEADDGRVELRAVTGPDYGRIWDHELVAAVMKIASNGTGDTRWKVPGVLDWDQDGAQSLRGRYQGDDDALRRRPRRVPVSGRRYPPDRGWTPADRGSPDLYFRGFYGWNREVGSKTLGIASFYLRAVCMNRNLWGVEELRGNQHPAFQVRRPAPRP